jgi:hypothetical protein
MVWEQTLLVGFLVGLLVVVGHGGVVKVGGGESGQLA